MGLKKWIKQIFCSHKNNEVVCWHWTHGYTMLGVRHIELQVRCKDCGKYRYLYIFDQNVCKDFEQRYKEKQWSDKCQPVK